MDRRVGASAILVDCVFQRGCVLAERHDLFEVLLWATRVSDGVAPVPAGFEVLHVLVLLRHAQRRCAEVILLEVDAERIPVTDLRVQARCNRLTGIDLRRVGDHRDRHEISCLFAQHGIDKRFGSVLQVAHLVVAAHRTRDIEDHGNLDLAHHLFGGANSGHRQFFNAHEFHEACGACR